MKSKTPLKCRICDGRRLRQDSCDMRRVLAEDGTVPMEHVVRYQCDECLSITTFPRSAFRCYHRNWTGHR
jgi:hypothetical protein